MPTTHTLHKLHTLQNHLHGLNKSLGQLQWVVPRLRKFIIVFIIRPMPHNPHHVFSHIITLPASSHPKAALVSHVLQNPVKFAKAKWKCIFQQYNRAIKQLQEFSKLCDAVRCEWVYSRDVSDGDDEVAYALTRVEESMANAEGRVRKLKNGVGWIHGTMVTEVDSEETDSSPNQAG